MPRSDWADAADSYMSAGEDGLLEESRPTQFDKTEWE